MDFIKLGDSQDRKIIFKEAEICLLFAHKHKVLDLLQGNIMVHLLKSSKPGKCSHQVHTYSPHTHL